MPIVYDYIYDLSLETRKVFDEQRMFNVEQGEPEQPALYRNHYWCHGCDNGWTDVWSSEVTDECPQCGRDIYPHETDDITVENCPSLGELYCGPLDEAEVVVQAIMIADRITNPTGGGA